MEKANKSRHSSSMIAQKHNARINHSVNKAPDDLRTR